MRGEGGGEWERAAIARSDLGGRGRCGDDAASTRRERRSPSPEGGENVCVYMEMYMEKTGGSGSERECVDRMDYISIPPPVSQLGR